MKVSREGLLQALEAVSAGLANNPNVQQSSCVVFIGGEIITFNDEIACRTESPLGPDIEGAVPAKPLMELLSKLSETDIVVTQDEKHLLIKAGSARRAKINLEADIQMPIEHIERAGEWVEMDPEFNDAVGIVQTTAASGSKAEYLFTCIHISSTCLESCDRTQATRYELETGIGRHALVRRDALKHVPVLGMHQISESDNWLHFRNKSGLVLSCRSDTKNEYCDLDPLFEIEDAKPAKIPSGMDDAVNKATTFTADNSNTDSICLKLKNGILIISGTGNYGEYHEKKKVDYDGQLSFMIPPKLLTEISDRSHDCLLSSSKLKVDTGKFQYITCLGTLE